MDKELMLLLVILNKYNFKKSKMDDYINKIFLLEHNKNEIKESILKEINSIKQTIVLNKKEQKALDKILERWFENY